jgi:SAM-dependent methyltransferase
MSERFAFGKNWFNFLSVLDEERVRSSTEDLRKVVGDLQGRTFLDVGCGSGIHSLAAVRLGATHVHSFDYDLDSVECAREVKRRFAPESNWTIEQGSALVKSYICSLGQFDVVYSWGVLHHTGDMWGALDLLVLAARETLMLAIYNDQGRTSRFWGKAKRCYNSGSFVTKRLLELFTLTVGWGPSFILYPIDTTKKWRGYSSQRGMSPWHDVVDWAGGYPFEVAKPEQIFKFCRDRGFILEELTTCAGGLGCNQFVFTRRFAAGNESARHGANEIALKSPGSSGS